MAAPLYTQTVIAFVWDFDKTLITGYSQRPIFEEYRIDEREFWDEVNQLKARYAERELLVGDDTIYLSHILSYVRAGRMPGLTNSRLRELGSRIEMCPGIPSFLQATQQLIAADERYASHNIAVEHYVVSTGMRQLIQGSAVGAHVERVWANELLDQPPPPGYLKDGYSFGQEGEVAAIGYTIDNTSKTRAIFEINKGPDVSVNALMPEDERRVPIRNMIYIADGPSDVPVFSVINKHGGRTLGVYQVAPRSNFDGVKRLQDEGRVNSIAPAVYGDESQASLWLILTLKQIADRICEERERFLQGYQGPAGHVV